VERSHGTLSIFLQVVEVGSVVPVADAVEDAEMQFERLLNLIENAPDTGRASVAGHLLHLAITQEIDVKLGTQLLQSLCKRQAVLP